MVGEGDGRWGGRPAGARVQNDRGCAGEAFFDVQDGSSSPFEVTVGTLDSDCSPTPSCFRPDCCVRPLLILNHLRVPGHGRSQNSLQPTVLEQASKTLGLKPRNRLAGGDHAPS